MKVDGACHCGRIHFTAEVDPAKVMICNCSDCQVISGAPLRAIVPADMASFQLSGAPKRYVKTAESGAKRVQAFCPDCGTALFSAAAENPTQVTLRLGCIRQGRELRPSLQLWQRSAVPWLKDLPGIPGVPTQSPPGGTAPPTGAA
jgi:hypothetical protein